MTKKDPHIILHLKISEEEIGNYLCQKIQLEPLSDMKFNFPSAFDETNFASYKKDIKGTKETNEVNYEDYNLHIRNLSLDEFKNVPLPDADEEENSIDVKFRILSAMCEFSDANRRNEWPRSTSQWCRWCCDFFPGPPISIPKYLTNSNGVETFFVYGCYCGFSCAAAHLFFRGDIPEEEKWESYELLHLLRKKLLNKVYTEKIILAGPQELLKVFGGYLTSEEFREQTKETLHHHKVYKIIYPPMISIIPKIEESIINNSSYDNKQFSQTNTFHSWNNENTFVPVDKDKISKAKEHLRITRSKPLLDKKNTLFNYMNLHIEKNG